MKFHTKYILLVLVVVSSFKGLYSQNNSKNFNQLSELCRVWGYLKYFNKEVSQSNIDWDSVLVEILPEFYLNQSKSEFNSRLNKYLFISSNAGIFGV